MNLRNSHSRNGLMRFETKKKKLHKFKKKQTPHTILEKLSPKPSPSPYTQNSTWTKEEKNYHFKGIHTPQERTYELRGKDEKKKLHIFKKTKHLTPF